MLLGIAGLAGWLNEFAHVRALDVLGERMSRALPAAIERTEQLALPPGS